MLQIMQFCLYNFRRMHQNGVACHVRDVVRHLSQQADLGVYRMGKTHLRKQVQITATHGMAGV